MSGGQEDKESMQQRNELIGRLNNKPRAAAEGKALVTKSTSWPQPSQGYLLQAIFGSSLLERLAESLMQKRNERF